tara:strand:+ start:177 stop:350 length:174 start_codon:yes stop_codon:yes gene_type:complete
MFGFWSLLPFSTSGTVIHNGQDEDIILFIQQGESVNNSIQGIITLDLTLQKDSLIII